MSDEEFNLQTQVSELQIQLAALEERVAAIQEQLDKLQEGDEGLSFPAGGAGP